MPHELPLIRDLLVLLTSSIVVSLICFRIRVPMLIGFMLTGILIGPHGLGLIRDVHAVEILAEIGVVLLLFTVGLEFSLKSLFEMRKIVVNGGGLQVVATTAVVTLIFWMAGKPLNQGIFYGFLCTLSSTALVLKTYADRAETDTPHGRIGLGVLLFQDLCVVPMMLLVPILSGKESASIFNLGLRLGSAVLTVVVIILAGQYLIPKALFQIVRLRSREVFVGFVVLISLGTAWVTSQVGLSLALGSFLAGLVLADSEYSHQIVADILPFRDVFNSIFFVSVGMLLSITALMANLGVVLVVAVGLLIIKLVLVGLVTLFLGKPLRVALVAGLGLAQIGEFSFILAKSGLEQHLMSENGYQVFLAASILTLIATPFLIQAAPKAGFWLQKLVSGAEPPADEVESNGKPTLSGHVVIVGYGLNGKNLSRVLRKVGVDYTILELNPDTVRKCRDHGEPIHYGDSTQREVLHSVGVENARVLVIAISDPVATRRTVAIAREMNPHLHIIVRTRFMLELQPLYQLGADQVIPEEFETSIEIFSRVLAKYGIADLMIHKEAAEIRHEGYKLLREPAEAPQQLSQIASILSQTSTVMYQLPEKTSVAGKTIGHLHLRKKTGASVIATLRNNFTTVNPGPEYAFAGGDIVVLLGSPTSIEQAIDLIESGSKKSL